MELQDTQIIETIFPCWAYALARVGKKDLLSLDWIKKKISALLTDYDKDCTQIGDILVWKNSDPGSGLFYAPVNIIGGTIIWEKLNYDYHACIYEGDDLITDMVKTDGNFDLPWIIRKRRLSDLSDPDFVIRFGE